MTKNLTSNYGDLTIAFDDYKSNSRFWWCNISLWWQHIIKDFGDVTLAFDDYKLWKRNLTSDFGDVTIAFDDYN